MLKLIFSLLTFLFISNLWATTPVAENVFLKIQEKVEEICQDKEDKDSCKKEMHRCVHRESLDFPFDALETLENTCQHQS